MKNTPCRPACLNRVVSKKQIRISPISKLSMTTLAAVSLVLVAAGTAEATSVVFDNMSSYESGNASATVNSTGSTPNTFMGDAYTLAAGTTEITGFDIFPVNASGTSFTGIKITIDVWGNVNMGAVNATTPAFGNLLGSYTLTSSGSFTTGFFFPFEGSPVGSTPGISLGSPLAIPGTTIGLSFNYQGTTDGVNYNSFNGLSSIISAGTTPTVGSDVFDGYYRNANSETDGNFTSTLRLLGLTDQSLGVRIYGDNNNATTADVPDAGSTLMLLTGALGAMASFKRRGR